MISLLTRVSTPEKTWDKGASAVLLCVQRSVDLLLFTCLEDDWDKLMRLVEFYARDKSYLSQVSGAVDVTLKPLTVYPFYAEDKAKLSQMSG